LVLVLSGWGISGKSVVQKNQMGINESYIGCLMFDNDPNSTQKCSDLRWGSEQALYNNIKRPYKNTIKYHCKRPKESNSTKYRPKIVNASTPDRYSYNPRLQHKAEEKLKEISNC